MPYFCWLIQFKVNQDKRCTHQLFGHNSTFFFWYSMLYKVWSYYNFIINHILKQIKDRGDCKVIDRCFRLVSKLFIDLNTFLDTLYIALAATSRALGSRLTGYNGFNLNFDFRGSILNTNYFYTLCYVIICRSFVSN